METRVKKWGNSLALRIPKLLAMEVGLDDEAPVELSLEGGRLVISLISEPQERLERLLERVTEANLHSEVDSGPAVGGEAW